MAAFRVDDSFDFGVLAGASCAFGVFDGFHLGHRFLVDQAIATKGAGRSVAITFDIDPDEVFHPSRLKKLMRNAARVQALADSGVDDVVVLPFTPELYSLEPEEFLAQLFCQGTPAHLHVGRDFRFGARAAGTVDTLNDWARQAGCVVHAHDLVSSDGEPITATRVRKLLLNCDLDAASNLLGHAYELTETVKPGRGEGTGFGFATANLEVKPHDRVLGEGVYAAYASVDGVRYKAAVSVGVSPTFEASATANMEVHVLGFEGDLVGKPLRVEFAHYLRGMRKFETTDELIATIKADIQWVQENL